MAALTTNLVTSVGGEPDVAGALVAAAVGGDTAEVGPGLFLYVANASAVTVTVTLDTPGTADGHAIADGTLVVLAADDGFIPLTNIFRGSTGRASITYSAVTTVTVGVFKLGA